jgi:hypothetical protein
MRVFIARGGKGVGILDVWGGYALYVWVVECGYQYCKSFAILILYSDG